MTSHLDFQILLLEELVIALNTHRPTFSGNLNFVDAAFLSRPQRNGEKKQVHAKIFKGKACPEDQLWFSVTSCSPFFCQCQEFQLETK